MDKTEAKSAPSACSVKSRKSTNLISSLIRRTRRKKSAAGRSIENLEGSGYTLDLVANSSSSFVAGNDPEAGISEAKDSMLINIIELQEASEERSGIDSELESPKAMPRTVIAGRRVTRRLSAETDQQCFEGMEQIDTVRTRASLEDLNDNINCGESAAYRSRYTQSSDRDVYNDLMTSKITAAPTTVLHFGKPCVDATLCDGIHYVQEIITNLVESEQHLVQLIKKHIYDSSFQKELLEALQQHSKLQWEAERRANALSNDMWVQQGDIIRAQERSLQEMLNSLVRQNRQLQLEKENLSRKNERMASRLRLYPEYSPRNRSIDLNNSVVEKLTKSNERLQGKLEAYMQQTEILEKDVKVSQKQNESLDHYARNLQAQIQNLKSMLQRSKADYELEQASLSHQLQTNQDIIKEAIETGDVVLEDLEAVRRRMKDLPFNINWTKFKCRGCCLTDLLHVCRSCINEFSRELVEAHNQIAIKDKDIASLEEAKTIIENTLRKTEEQIDTAEEKANLLQDSSKVISNITSENCALRSQLDGLNRLLNESGAGDVARELASSHDKMSQFQSLYYQVQAEKTLLMEQLTASDNERTRLVRYQDMCHQQLQAQLMDMEIMNKELVTVKGQLESERGTVISLQAERTRYLEEKGVLRSIFLRLKNEIDKVQNLEATVASITKESSRLAMIAEYNKQLGEKLKEELVERDQTISELKLSVDKLQGLQVENAKDKLSLCAELSQVCSLKERLNSSLEKEVKRSRVLDETKKEMETSSAAQFKKLVNEQKHERATLKELMKEYKMVLSQRNSLFEAHKNLQLELSKSEKHSMIQINNCERLCVEISEKELRIKDLVGKLQDYEQRDKNRLEELKEEQQRHERVLRKMEKVLKQLREEKKDQEERIAHLKKNIQKLQSDLDDARQSEKETLDKCKIMDEDKYKIVQKCDETKAEMTKLLIENEKLHEDVKYLSYMYEKVLADLEASIQASADKEDIFKREIEESKKILITSENHLQTISKILYEKDNEIARISDQATLLAKENDNLQSMIQDYKQQQKLLDDIIQTKDKAEKDLCKFKRDHENCTLQISSLKKETEKLKAELHTSENTKRQLVEDNHELTTRISTQLNQMTTLQESNEHIAQIHQEANSKLLSVLEQLAQEKIAGQEAQRRLTHLTIEHSKLQTESDDLLGQNQKLKSNLSAERARVQEVSKEKAILQGKVDSMQAEHEQVMNNLRNIEMELREEKHKLQSILSKPLEADHGKIDVRIYQETILALKESEARTDRLKQELEDSHQTILELRGEIAKLEHQVTTLEFQKCELTLRLHETNGKVDTERSLYLELKNEQQQLVSAIMQLKKDGKIENHHCTYLLRVLSCPSTNFVDTT